MNEMIGWLVVAGFGFTAVAVIAMIILIERLKKKL